MISPIANTYFQLTDEKYKRNERQALKLVNKILPFIQSSDPSAYQKYKPIIDEFEKITLSKRYNNLPMVKNFKSEEN